MKDLCERNSHICRQGAEGGGGVGGGGRGKLMGKGKYQEVDGLEKKKALLNGHWTVYG